MSRLSDNLRRSHHAVWFAIGLTWLVTALLVAWGARALRDEVRAQILGRDAVLLQAMVRAVRAADAEIEIGGDDPMWVFLRMEYLEGVLAARLYDTGGELLVSLPTSVRDDVVPAEAWESMHQLQPLSRFHPEYRLSRVLHVTNTVELMRLAQPLPAIEVFVPFEKGGGRDDAASLDAVGWFLIDGRKVQAEFARFESALWLRAGLLLVGAIVVTGMALGWAFRRLSSVNRLLARRTDDLQRANLEIVQSARVAALGAVTAHLMHGLKSPVSGLHSFVASTRAAAPEEESWGEALAATERMQALIQQVVRVLSDHDLDLGYEVTLGEAAEAVLQRARPQADKKGVRLVIEGQPLDRMDNRAASLLILLLSNLVENAIDVTPAGGVVRLRFPEGTPGTCDVVDEGDGLPAEVQARLFQPQRSTKAGGSGLGLAITRQLALALEATVRVEQTGPGGTVFRVILPPPSRGGGQGVLWQAAGG